MTNKTKKDWIKLDNAAKIFPPTSNKRDTKVFRFACQLNDEINQSALQDALDLTIEEFPLFQSVLRHGVFWYYLERTDIKPMVTKETRPPCSVIYDRTSKHLLFDVTYFNNRISLEVYHALTDGTGAMQFLKSLVINYISIYYLNEQSGTTSDYDASYSQRNEDSFQKYYTEQKSNKLFNSSNVYKISGQLISDNRLLVIEGDASVKQLLEIAHKHNTTLTIYLAAVFLYSIYQDMPKRHHNKTITMDVPVNLRNYFNSATARNFFGVINVGHKFTKDSNTLESVIESLKNSFKKELTEQELSKRISKLTSIEHNYVVRAIPLFIKDPVLKMANQKTQKNITCSLSNIGKITISPEYAKFIDKFAVYISTQKVQAGVCSFNDKITISFSSPFVSTEIQKNFFRHLANENIDIKISSNNEQL